MMSIEEAIGYLSPIAESAALPRYKEALGIAIGAMKEKAERERPKDDAVANPCDSCCVGWASISGNGVKACHDDCEKLKRFLEAEAQT